MHNFRWLRTFSLILITLLGAGCNPFRGRTSPITNPDGVAILESVALGGMQQWILIRGQDKTAPVLLWLHGGPGAAQMPLVHAYNRELEEDFIVVHWDQRGAGKSNPKNFDESTMTIQQFVQDAHELTLYLKDKFHHDKIYLAGHSWGTQFGVLLARDYPQDYHAYINLSCG